MEDIFSLEIFEEDVYIPTSARSDLFSMCKLMEEFDNLMNEDDPWYISEAVQNAEKVGTLKKINRTRAVMNDTIAMFDDLTDGQAWLYNEEFNLLRKITKLIGAIGNFLYKIIGWIPRAIIGVINGIGAIPNTVRKLISGNISLYVTIEDIETVYAQGVIGRIDDICAYAQTLSKGEMWSSFLSRMVKGAVNIVSHINPKRNDAKIPANERQVATKLVNTYRELSNINFSQTTINLKNPTIKEIYFGTGGDGNGKEIKFRGIKILDKHVTTYPEALQILANSIVERQNKLKEVSKMLDIKWDETHANGSWGDLPPLYQTTISRSYKAMAGTIDIVAKIMKYISTDIRTYNKTLDNIKAAAEKEKSKADKYNQKVDVNDTMPLPPASEINNEEADDGKNKKKKK